MPILGLDPAAPPTPRMQISEDMLWRYIDGDSPPGEAPQIARALESNAELSLVYDDLVAYHERFGALLARDAELPSDLPSADTPAAERLTSGYDVQSPVRSN